MIEKLNIDKSSREMAKFNGSIDSDIVLADKIDEIIEFLNSKERK